MTPPSQPRLAPVPFAEWDDDTRATLLSHLRRPELYLSGGPDAPPMPIVLELFAHHVPLSETFLSFTDVMASDQSKLEPRIRELADLAGRVAHQVRATSGTSIVAWAATRASPTASSRRSRRARPSAVWTPRSVPW